MKRKLTVTGPIFDQIEKQLGKTIKSLLASGIDDREIVFKLSEAIVNLAEESKERESVLWLRMAAIHLAEESQRIEISRGPMVRLVDTMKKPSKRKPKK